MSTMSNEASPQPTNNSNHEASPAFRKSNSSDNIDPLSTTPTPRVTPKASAQAAQMKKLHEANAKYKNLLKMAKERIQQQEEELEKLRSDMNAMKVQKEQEQRDAAGNIGMDDADTGDAAESSSSIANVCLRVKARVSPDMAAMSKNNNNSLEEIWALIDFEVDLPDQPEFVPPKRYRKWKRFNTEAELSDFIRRDTGEPLTLPPYALSPEQSDRIQDQAKQEVSKVTEEFRRFRVRAELARKQADAHIRDLQNSNVQTAQRRIEGQDLDQQLEQARSERGQLERLKAEMAEQEAQWKEAYDVLLAENNALKSSGSEALLAAQWRQRYETCMAEKENLQSKLQTELDKQAHDSDEKRKADAGKYERKYRDLKESFRLYRSEARKIFDAQNNGDVKTQLLHLADRGTEESKLNYLKNLMVNYLTAEVAVRDHMEVAIGTVLQFTPDDLERIKQKKNSESWF